MPREKSVSPAPAKLVERRLRRQAREVLIRAGVVALRARLTSSATADRIWAALPIYATAEVWDQALSFETRARSDCGADLRDHVIEGEIAFCPDEQRTVIAWAAASLPRPRKIRLPAPCNVWALALDDVGCLTCVQPSERVAVLVAES